MTPITSPAKPETPHAKPFPRSSPAKPRARQANLVGFAVRVLAEPAAIGNDDVAALRSEGWTERDIAEVVGIVALNLLTGAFNLVAGI